ncbi:MAG: hypothetical protein ACF8SC_06555 [Phycisphaerales bacterium JB037]
MKGLASAIIVCGLVAGLGDCGGREPERWREAVEADPDLPNEVEGDWVLFPPGSA